MCVTAAYRGRGARTGAGWPRTPPATPSATVTTSPTSLSSWTSLAQRYCSRKSQILYLGIVFHLALTEQQQLSIKG